MVSLFGNLLQCPVTSLTALFAGEYSVVVASLVDLSINLCLSLEPVGQVPSRLPYFGLPMLPVLKHVHGGMLQF